MLNTSILGFTDFLNFKFFSEKCNFRNVGHALHKTGKGETGHRPKTGGRFDRHN